MLSLKPFQIILVAALLIFSPATATMAQSEELYTNPTILEIEDIMKQKGYDVKYLDEENLVAWVLGNGKFTTVSITEPNILNFRTFGKNVNISLDKINEWNSGHSFGKAYIDAKKNAVLELYMDYTGGVTKERMLDFFETCEQSQNEWLAVVQLK